MSKNEDDVTVVIKDPSSRLCPSPKHIYEVFTEYVCASAEKQSEPTLLQTFPKDYEWDEDTKKNFPKFCFPCKPFTVSKAQCFTFTLTDIDGNYRFGFCYYPKGTNCVKCYCLFSYLPWFEFFYWALEKVSEFKKDLSEVHKVEPFLSALYDHSIPDINNMDQEAPTISITPQSSLSQTYRFSLPHPLKSPVLPKDHNLNLMYTNLSHEVIIAIFASAIFERRIIMHSNSLSLLSACIHATDIMLYPLHWQHIFCPIMPPSLMDYCCAPMPFLMGIHKSLMEDVYKMPIDDVVIVDLDDNQLESPYLAADLEGFPASSLHSLEKVLKKPSSTQGDSVAKAFLDLFVAIIGGYQSALKLRPGDKEISFDQDLFIKSRANMSSLLENLLQFQHFQQFINGRIQRKKGSGMNRDRFDDALNAWEDTPAKKTIEAESLKEGILLAMKVTKKGISRGGGILHKKGGQMLSKWQEQLSTRYGEKEHASKRHLERSTTQLPSATNPTDLYFRDPEAVRRLVQLKQAHLNKTPPPVPKSYQRHKQERDSIVDPDLERSTEIPNSGDSNALPYINVMKADTSEPPVANLVPISPPPTPPPRRRGRQRANAQSKAVSVDTLLGVPDITAGDTVVDSPDVVTSSVSESHSSSDDVDTSSTTSSSSGSDVIGMTAPPLPPRDELMENTYVTMLQSENVDLSLTTRKVAPPLPPRDHDDLPIFVPPGNPPPLPPRDLLSSPIQPDSMLSTRDLPKPVPLPPRDSNTPPVPPRDRKKNSPKLHRQAFTPPTQQKNTQPLAHCNSTEMQRKLTQSPELQLIEMDDGFSPGDGFCLDMTTEFGQSVARELMSHSRSSFTEEIAKKISSSFLLRPSKAVMQSFSGDDPFGSSLPPPLLPSTSSTQSETKSEQPPSSATSNPLDSLLDKNDYSKWATTTHNQQEKLENNSTTPNGNVLT